MTDIAATPEPGTDRQPAESARVPSCAQPADESGACAQPADESGALAEPAVESGAWARLRDWTAPWDPERLADKHPFVAWAWGLLKLDFTGIAFGQYLGAHGFAAIADHGEIAGDDAGR